MKTIKAPNEEGRIIECALLKTKRWGMQGCYCLFEDLNEYGAVYSYDIDRNVFVKEEFPKIL